MNDQTVIQEPTTEEESSWNSLIIDELNRLTATVKAEDPENDLDPMWHDEMREAFPKIFDILDENHLLDTPMVAITTYEMLGRFIHRLPLTAVDVYEEGSEDWNDITKMMTDGNEDAKYRVFQSRRLGRLFARVNNDGTVVYQDMERSLFEDDWIPDVFYHGNHLTEHEMAAFPHTIKGDPYFSAIYDASVNQVSVPYYPMNDPKIVKLSFYDYLKCCAMSVAARHYIEDARAHNTMANPKKLTGTTCAFNIYVTELKRMYFFLHNHTAGLIEVIHFSYDPEEDSRDSLVKIVGSIAGNIGHNWGDIYGKRIYYVDVNRNNRKYKERIMLPITVDADLSETKKALNLYSVYGDKYTSIFNAIKIDCAECANFDVENIRECIHRISGIIPDTCADDIAEYFINSQLPDPFDSTPEITHPIVVGDDDVTYVPVEESATEE